MGDDAYYPAPRLTHMVTYLSTTLSATSDLGDVARRIGHFR